MQIGQNVWPDAPAGFAEVQSEFGRPLPRLAEQPDLEFAAAGVWRRSGKLTGVALSYFDLRTAVSAPDPPPVGAPDWLSEWTARLVHPLLEDVVRIWTQEEFGRADPSPELMLRVMSGLKDPGLILATEEAMSLDGRPVAGFSFDSEQSLLRAAEITGTWVLVTLPCDLASGIPQLTTLAH